MNNNWFVVILIYSCAFACSGADEKIVVAKAGELKLEVKVSGRYTVGSEILIDIDLANSSPRNIAVLRPPFRMVDLELRSKDGRQMRLDEIWSASLGSGSDGPKRNCNKCRSVTKSSYKLGRLYDLSLTGEYVLTVRFRILYLK